MKRSLDSSSVLDLLPSKRINDLDNTEDNNNEEQRLIEIVELPNEYAAILGGIGTGVQNFKTIESQTGCKITLGDGLTKQGTKFITFIGTRNVIDTAKTTVNELLTSFFPVKQTTSESKISECLMIPGHKCGLIIGKNGDTIRQLQEQLSVKLLLIQDSVALTTEKPLRIYGEQSKVMYAKEEITRMIYGDSEAAPIPTVTNNTSIQIDIPRFAVGFVIGKKGENIRKMSQDTECHLSFEFEIDSSSPSRLLTIQGPYDKIKCAKKLVKDLVERCRKNIETSLNKNEGSEVKTIIVNPGKAGIIIGKCGENIKQINQESGAFVELARDASKGNQRVFSIRGSSSQIEYAIYLIKMKIGEIDAILPYSINNQSFEYNNTDDWVTTINNVYNKNDAASGDNNIIHNTSQEYSDTCVTSAQIKSTNTYSSYTSAPPWQFFDNSYQNLNPAFTKEFGKMWAEYYAQNCPHIIYDTKDGYNNSEDDISPPGC